MCIICVSPTGVRQPNFTTIRTMFRNNPHGAGYMFARDGKVHISKGYMNIDSFLDAMPFWMASSMAVLIALMVLVSDFGMMSDMEYLGSLPLTLCGSKM